MTTTCKPPRGEVVNQHVLPDAPEPKPDFARMAETLQQGVDFDRDLARLDQIRRAHRSARPSHENPAWQNSHTDCTFLLGFIDSLWGAYTREGRKADAAAELLVALKRAAHELEQYVDLQQKMDYIEYAASTQEELDVVKAAIAKAEGGGSPVTR